LREGLSTGFQAVAGSSSLTKYVTVISNVGTKLNSPILKRGVRVGDEDIRFSHHLLRSGLPSTP
jgi:hypothetical protein